MKTLDLTVFLRGKKGIELYSPIFGECILGQINEGMPYSITVKDNNNLFHSFTKEGYYYNNENINPECLLFPSKEKRNWDNFGKQRVKRGEFYFSLMLTASGAITLEKQDNDKAVDRQSYSSGNYFTTEKEAQEYADKINDILKNRV